MPLISFPPRSSSRSAVTRAGNVGRRDTTPVPKSSPEGYQPQFDGLRALAVLTVMLDHFSAGVPNFPLPDSIRLGATGVRLFLVLSGYFITMSLRRARGRIEAGGLSARQALGSFYWRRFLRILPAYGLFTIVGLVLNLGTIRQHWGWILTGTVNWLIAWSNAWPPAISHLWSICVQEQFYLFWPLLILILPRRWMLGAILAVALTGVAFRIGCVMFSVPMIARWVLPFGSLDSLAAGAALGWYGGRLKASRASWLVGAVCVSMLVLAAILRDGDPARMRSVLVEPLEAIAFVVLVARTATGFHGWVARFLTLPGLVFAGRISYGLYIYHVLVAVLFDLWMPAPLRWLLVVPAARLTMFGIVTLLVAAVSWRLLEEPINRFRGGKKRPAITPAPGADSEPALVSSPQPVAPLAVLAVRPE